MQSGDLSVSMGIHLDPLAAVMACVVTGVGLLIHIYSTAYMAEEPDYARFFAYMNLFVACMLVLVLADNLLSLYLGWEGVGLCSYLLIGFWYRDRGNCAAAMKAFIVTRIGDAAMAVGLLLIAVELGTLNISEALARAQELWPVGGTLATVAAGLLLAGAIGKSAQVPLHVWLPDAMAGPTPVSALIHAATMVTAGAYLLARMHALTAVAPAIMLTIAVIGIASILIGAVSALAQRDLKRILAYSTMSQVGYMFLALGVGAWTAAIFHLVTHAFFKSLLFLAAGALIHAMRGEQDIFAMRGLRRKLPMVFTVFVIGSAALAGLPLVTAGFYSKEMILGATLHLPTYGPYFWGAGLVGVLLTSIYAFRAAFVAFRTSDDEAEPHGLSLAMTVPLGVLAALSIVAGMLGTPHGLGNVQILSQFLAPASHVGESAVGPLIVASAASLLGIGVAWLVYVRFRESSERLAETDWALGVTEFCKGGCRFDALYNTMLVEPFAYVAGANAPDIIDRGYDLVARAIGKAHQTISRLQDGRLRWYVGGLALGAVFLVGVVVLR